MRKKIILFYVDIKSRDLQSLSLISFYLRKKYFIFFAPIYEWRFADCADCVIINKLHYADDQITKWKRQNKQVILIDTEGKTFSSPNSSIYKKIDVFPNLYFFWNNVEMDKYKKQMNEKNCDGYIGGYFRSDFCHRDFRSIYDYSKISQKYNLKKKKVITFASSFTQWHSRGSYKKKKPKRISIFKKFINTDLEEKNILQLNKMTKKILNFLNNYHNLEIIFKPHPNEDSSYWDNFLKEKNYENIKIFKGDNINTLLSISSLHISHNFCLTVIDAKMFNLPVIEITNKYTKFGSKTHLIGDYQINNLDKLKILIDKLIQNQKLINKKDKIKKYISRYFYKFDGKRCYYHAKKIDQYLNKDKKQNISLFYLFKNLATIYLNLGSSIIFKAFILSLKRFLKKEINYDIRGRYNHRIGYFDYLEEYNKFEKLKWIKKKIVK